MVLQAKNIDKDVNDRLRAYAKRQGFTLNTTLKKAIKYLEGLEKRTS